jgi:hypothetical protein
MKMKILGKVKIASKKNSPLGALIRKQRKAELAKSFQEDRLAEIASNREAGLALRKRNKKFRFKNEAEFEAYRDKEWDMTGQSDEINEPDRVGVIR